MHRFDAFDFLIKLVNRNTDSVLYEIDMARNTMSYLVDDALEKVGNRLASIKVNNL